MLTCAACSIPLRAGARFCTRCGAPVVEAPVVPVDAADPEPEPAPKLEREPVPEDAADSGVDSISVEVPSRIPTVAPSASPPRTGSGVGALIAGIAPLVISVIGNLVAAELARTAQAQLALGVIAVVFILTAGSLAVCGILGVRALRDSVTPSPSGRALAIAGLAVGGVNLVFWIAGLVITVASLSSVTS